MARNADATRDERLKAALKANMARRKTQRRARVLRPAAVDADEARDRDEGTDGMDERSDG